LKPTEKILKHLGKARSSIADARKLLRHRRHNTRLLMLAAAIGDVVQAIKFPPPRKLPDRLPRGAASTRSIRAMIAAASAPTNGHGRPRTKCVKSAEFRRMRKGARRK
jgi:hypothetical protein